ncbi:hypothetical protein SUGI_0978030 [Cryptomeria japonica]|nr:hypothetical protein SUGI_0978030 [Cryptomeria japonica]
MFKGIEGSFGVGVLSSGIIEAAAFPPAIPCPELVRECIGRYDPVFKTIRRDNGETLLAINRELVLEGKQYLDWVELIADSMREQLSIAKQFKQNFFMSSYLIYCLACVKEIVGIPRQLIEEEVSIYDFYPMLQKDNAFLGDLCYELKNMKTKRMSEDAQASLSNSLAFAT